MEKAASTIRSELEQALRLLDQTCMRSHEPRVHAALSDLARRMGDDRVAEQELITARQICEQIGAAPDAVGVAGTSGG